jgi:hypothetical protein
MPTVLAQFVMFVSSYAPLLVVFALLDSFGRGVPSIVCLALAATGSLGLAVIISVGTSINPRAVVLTETQARDSEAIGYVVTYLLPFVGFQATTGRERLALLIFFGLLALLYIRSGLFYVNPLLSAVGYHLFAAQYEGRAIMLMSKRRTVAPPTELKARFITESVFLEA